MKLTINGFIVYRTANYWNDDERFKFAMYDPRAQDKPDGREVFVKEHSIEVEVPDAFDPRPAQVALLVAEKRRVQAEFSARVTELDAQINKLLALENTVEAA